MFILPGIPLVSVTYLAIWTFIDVLPSKCKDISSRLDSLKDKLANYCRFLTSMPLFNLRIHLWLFRYFYNLNHPFSQSSWEKKPTQSKQILRHRTLKDDPGSNNFKLVHQHFSLVFFWIVGFLISHLYNMANESFAIQAAIKLMYSLSWISRY